MYSRTFSLFVAVACATFSIAAPLHNSPVGGLVGNLGLGRREGLDALNGVVSKVKGVADAGSLPNLPVPRGFFPPIPGGEDVPNPYRRAAADPVTDLLTNAVENPTLPAVPAAPGSSLSSTPLPRDATDPLTGALSTVEQTVGPLAGAGAGVPATSSLGGLGQRDAHTNGAAGSILDPLDTISVNDIKNPRAVAHPSLPDIFQGLTDKIQPIVVKLEAAVSVKADINIEVVVGLLNDIVILIKAAIVDVQVIVDDPTGFALTLAGTIISVEALVGLIAILLHLLLPILLTVVVAVEGLAAGAVVTVVVTIGGLVATLLALVVRLVPTLIAILLPKITVLVRVIYYLRLADIVVVLGLPAHGY